MTKAFPSARALVVGGGVIGLCSALALQRAGFQVRLLERGQIGQQASWAGGGILSPLYPWRAPAPVWQLAAESLRVYPALCRELAERTGIGPEWTPSGMAVLDVGQADEAQRWAAQAGVLVELREFRLGPAGSVSGLWLPWVAQVRNPRLCKALRIAVEQAGARCEEALGELRLAGEGRRVAVVDPQGSRHEADVVVIAAGAWSAGLLAGLGWQLPVLPVKGQMILLQTEPGLLGSIVLRDGQYLIPRRDGRIVVGSTVEPEAGFSCETDPEVASRLQDFARRWLPAAASFQIERHWAGIRPGTADECPIIARHLAFENLYINAGHYRNGLTLAPASAERLLEQVLAG